MKQQLPKVRNCRVYFRAGEAGIVSRKEKASSKGGRGGSLIVYFFHPALLGDGPPSPFQHRRPLLVSAKKKTSLENKRREGRWKPYLSPPPVSTATFFLSGGSISVFMSRPLSLEPQGDCCSRKLEGGDNARVAKQRVWCFVKGPIFRWPLKSLAKSTFVILV